MNIHVIRCIYTYFTTIPEKFPACIELKINCNKIQYSSLNLDSECSEITVMRCRNDLTTVRTI